MEVAAVAQKLSQEHLQSLSASRGGGLTTPCWSKLTGNPVREGATVTDDMEDRPEDTTVTGGVVVGAVVETWDIVHYKRV